MKFKILRLFIFTLIIVSISYKISWASDMKNILVIHSYNEGFLWTNSISKGIDDVFDLSNKDINVVYDYMDLKEVKSEDYFRKFHDIQKIKYTDRKFDVIIVSDNGAMDYIMMI